MKFVFVLSLMLTCYSSAQSADPGEYTVQLWRENLSLFSYFAFADENMKSHCRNPLFIFVTEDKLNHILLSSLWFLFVVFFFVVGAEFQAAVYISVAWIPEKCTNM